MKDFKPEIIWRRPEELTPYVRNSKSHPTEQVDKIAGQIASIGFTQPIVVDKDFVIIAGHGRREAAMRLGLLEVPVVVMSHLNEYEVMAARIADNKVAESDWEKDFLKFDLLALDHQNFEMSLTGFDEDELEKLMTSAADMPDPETKAAGADKYVLLVKFANSQDLQTVFQELQGRGFDLKVVTD